jgi:uncharacterized membrane protein
VTALAPAPTDTRRLVWAPWATALLLAGGYAALAVRDHQRLRTAGFDLGIFEEAVRSYAGGHPGIVEIKGPGFPQLGDHFSPVLVTLAPVYRIFPSAYTLLVAQAVLLAVAVVPLMRLARDTAGPFAAAVVAAGYGLSWGIAQTVGFDFHEVCFAVPILAYGVCALARRRLGPAAAWALALPLVKEDLGLTTAAIGLLIAGYGARRLGPAVAVTGVAATVVTTTLVIPAVNPRHRYDYLPAGGGAGPALHQLTAGLVTSPVKLTTVVLLLAPVAFGALRSPLLLIGVPSLALRFASPHRAYWGTGYHYSATLMPIVFAAFAATLSGRWARGFLIASLTVTLVLVPRFPLGDLGGPTPGVRTTGCSPPGRCWR